MRSPIHSLILLLLISSPLSAESVPSSSALAALRKLPRPDAKRLARIEARDGTPVPERWHLIVQEPKSENGLREYVVAGGEIVASREVSQFAESVRSEDVIGSDSLKINSDQVGKIAEQYANANNQSVARMHYELKKEGAAATPLWTVTCIDTAGTEIGRLVISAGRGLVISHQGFHATPPSAVIPLPPPSTSPVKPRIAPSSPLAKSSSRSTPIPVAIEVATLPITPPPSPSPPPKKPSILGRVGTGFNRVSDQFQKIIKGKSKENPPE
jgi:hypothetical protein